MIKSNGVNVSNEVKKRESIHEMEIELLLRVMKGFERVFGEEIEMKVKVNRYEG
jgi:hypothetical protein